MPTTQYKDTALAVRAVGARTDPAGVAVADVSAEEDRLINSLFDEGAIKPDNSFRVVAQGGNMNVVVGSGSAKSDLYAVQGDVAGQGVYIVRLDVATFTITIDPADAAQQRTDEIYLVVQDNAYDASLRGLPRLAVRKGDAGAGAPGPDAAWRAYVLLATVTVPAGATSIAAGNITDNRTFATMIHGVPAGTIQMYGGANAPSGWLLCNGAAVSRTTYARLFGVLGTTYGAGDGSTTFNVPNFSGRFPIGVGTLGSDTYARGNTGGSARHTLTTTELPAHNHTSSSGTAGSHSHTGSSGATTPTSAGDHLHTSRSGGSHTHIIQATRTATGSAVSHAHTEISTIGTGVTHASGSTSVFNFDEVQGAGDHYHLTDSQGAHTHGSHSHSIGADGGHTHTITIDNTGGGGAHENRPPYLAVNYIIKV